MLLKELAEIMRRMQMGPVTARLLSEGNDRQGPCVTASITISWQETGAKEIYMRNSFNIELKVDVLTSDAKRLETVPSEAAC